MPIELKPKKYRDALGSEKLTLREDDGASTTTRQQNKKVIRRGNQANSLTRNPTADTSKQYTGKDANLSIQLGKIREQQNKGLQELKKGGKVKKSKSRVNEAGNYTKPSMRKRLFNRIKAGGKGGWPVQWSARKAQMLASAYKKAGGGYKN